MPASTVDAWKRSTVIAPELLGQARELRADGATYSQIAQEFGVGKTTTIRRALTQPEAPTL